MKGIRKKIFDLGTFVNVLSLGALAIAYLDFFEKKAIEQAKTSYGKGSDIVQKTLKDLDETIKTSSANPDTPTEEAIRLLAEENAKAAKDFSDGSYALEKALEILNNIKKGIY